MKFAIIHTWPNVKNAEYECIERFKLAAKNIGAECILVGIDGYLTDHPSLHLSSLNVDFCLALHHLNYKIYNVFTYAILWNPPQFVDDWGGFEMSKNLVSCDGYLGYSSQYMLDFYNTIIASANKKVELPFEFVPSVPETILYTPTQRNNYKIFYSGINWERLGNQKGRHHDLFVSLDATGHMRYYGPNNFLGQNPWAGFASYQGPLPFDGISTIEAIHQCGISLVLSSDAHRMAGAATNRLYESCAAGAIMICDDNPFVMKYFHDAALFFNYDQDPEINVNRILEKVHWIKNHPEKAIALAKKAQEIYLEHFSLQKNLKNLFVYHTDLIKNKVTEKKSDPALVDVIFYITPNLSEELIKTVFSNINTQTQVKINLIIVATSSFNLDFIFPEHIATTIIDWPDNKTHGDVFLKTINFMKGSFFIFAMPDTKLADDHLVSHIEYLQNSSNSSISYCSYFAEDTSGNYHHIPTRQTLIYHDLNLSKILRFSHEMPVSLCMFKKSLLSGIGEFCLRQLDDYDNRHKLSLFLIESLKLNQLIVSTKKPTLLIKQNLSHQHLDIDKKKPTDSDQFSFIIKRYQFDDAYNQLLLQYPIAIPAVSFSRSYLSLFLKENFPNFHRITKTCLLLKRTTLHYFKILLNFFRK